MNYEDDMQYNFDNNTFDVRDYNEDNEDKFDYDEGKFDDKFDGAIVITSLLSNFNFNYKTMRILDISEQSEDFLHNYFPHFIFVPNSKLTIEEKNNLCLFPNLEELNCKGSYATQIIGCPNLIKLNCERCPVVFLQNLQHLTHLNINNACSLTKLPKKLPKLEELLCTDTRVEKIKSYYNLKKLLLYSNNNRYDDSRTIIYDLPNLEELICHDNHTTIIMKNFNKLKILKLSLCSVTKYPNFPNIISISMIMQRLIKKPKKILNERRKLTYDYGDAMRCLPYTPKLKNLKWCTSSLLYISDDIRLDTLRIDSDLTLISPLTFDVTKLESYTYFHQVNNKKYLIFVNCQKRLKLKYGLKKLTYAYFPSYIVGYNIKHQINKMFYK